jgi:hypothetical protein
MATDTTTPFQWGANGARMTPDDIAAQRKVAEALMTQGSDSSPLPTGTRGAGIWTQGLARVAKSIVGGYEAGQASRAADANAADNKSMIQNVVDAINGRSTASAAPATSAAPVASAAVVSDDANAVPGTVGMNQQLADRSQDFIQDNPGTSMTSGVRSTADQARLYADRDNNPNPVAVPGTSAHERGAAVDIGGMSPAARSQLPQYGLAQPVANDPPHVQLAAQPTAAAPTPGVAKVSGAISPAVLQAATSPYADSATKQIAGIVLAQQLSREKKDTYSQQTDDAGNIWSINNATGQRTVAKAADKDPASVQEYEYYKKNAPTDQTPMDYGTWSDHKARAAATNVSTNVDVGAAPTYSKQLVEGLGKSHAALANGVEDAQTRARDIAGMQGAIDAIQKNGGTTGGMGAAQVLELKKTLNSGATSLGLGQPFDENSLSDAELMQKLNRQMAGAQAKNAVGARVTNFDMQNYLAANPGLSLSPTANQRLLGIQAQVEQRNIAVGNAIRDATAAAVSKHQDIDPVTVQGIVTDYDKAHHVQDPVSGQDLTQSYALPEFQQPGQGTNSSLAVGHETNINGIRIKRVN